MNEPELSHPVQIGKIGSQKREIKLVADDATRKKIAERYKILAVDHLSGHLSYYRQGKKIFVSGTIKASLVQACVLTLQPVAEEIEENFDYCFVRMDKIAAQTDNQDAELLENLDGPEPIFGENIDLGELIVEQVALAMALYPRIEGAEWPEQASDGGETSAFADLRKIATEPGSD